MSGAREADAALRWRDAVMAAAALAVDPCGLGGAAVRARVGPVRDAWLALLAGVPQRRMPPEIADDRLLGGLDLAATLAAGGPVRRAGLIAEAAGGLLVLPMAERAAPALAGRLALALDRGGVGLVALDEGAEPDERLAPALAERLAFRLDLDGLARADLAEIAVDAGAARARLAGTALPPGALEALARAAAALGIGSLRAPLLAARAARVLAALAGREVVAEEDLAAAARLVLAPRALRAPESEPEAEPEAPEEPPPPPEPGADSPAEGRGPLEDVVLSAVRAVLPADLLAAMGAAARGPQGRQGGAGARTQTPLRGRPAGLRVRRRGDPARPDIVASLTAAAPWQALRRRETGREGVQVRAGDLRARRYVRPAESVLIFLVDASGSAAAARLAEAKGAVECLLARAYARREKVALVAFRRDRAEVLLAPTRSLARAKRQLGGLPGGGGTPLAAGLAAGLALALQARRAGATPALALLTDGRANVALDGAQGREAAAADAVRLARLIRAEGIAAVLVDTATRPQEAAAELARQMGATYLALPRAGAARFSEAVRAAVAP